jgi:hypothetical protein
MKKRVGQTGKTRFTMWIDADMLGQLEKLQSATGKSSVADVVREAVAVYSSIMLAAQRGVKLSFEDRKGEKGLIWLLPGPPPFE